jgi:signal transduction histidine kinase
MKILITDDSPTNLKLLRAVLESENFEVVEAADGAQALDVLEGESVDAIISDILMPRMDGYRLCYEVRKNKRWQALPFIFYTATYTSPGDEKLCFDLGGDKYLQKPASADTILTALREATNAPRRPAPNRMAALSETEVMREYSERLVSKLEAKNVELAKAKDYLERANGELAHRSEQLEKARADLQQANGQLELRVRQRAMELEASTLELEAFSYSVSHDLRAPLRHIGGFAQLVLKNGAARLDETNLKHVNIICNCAQKMNGLIDALLDLSRVSRMKVYRRPIDLSALARETVAELQQSHPERTVRTDIEPGISANGDQRLVQVALTNLIGNAWKFTRKTAAARIEFGRNQDEVCSSFFVRDNGAGFDMAYVNKLFTPFQRLHGPDQFEGTGIGLATVHRIIRRHGGSIWAEGVPDKGAAFYFTLGEDNDKEGVQTKKEMTQ